MTYMTYMTEIELEYDRKCMTMMTLNVWAWPKLWQRWGRQGLAVIASAFGVGGPRFESRWRKLLLLFQFFRFGKNPKKVEFSQYKIIRSNFKREQSFSCKGWRREERKDGWVWIRTSIEWLTHCVKIRNHTSNI